ncbi:MAG: hypothetical protein FJX53_05485 [Alphaproteobacteria bacterium]|nr:hypothetical protein [Alphaproteobacteria bacterium]
MKGRLETGFAKMKEGGLVVSELPAAENTKWAALLKDWPDERAKDADSTGLPGSKTLKLTLETAEKLGYTRPKRYVIK